MFIDLLSESARKGGGGVSLSDNEDEPIFQLFQLRQTHRIRNASFYHVIFWKGTPGNYCNDYYIYI